MLLRLKFLVKVFVSACSFEIFCWISLNLLNTILLHICYRFTTIFSENSYFYYTIYFEFVTSFFRLKYIVKVLVIDCNVKKVLRDGFNLKLLINIRHHICYSIPIFSETFNFEFIIYSLFRGFEFSTSILSLKFLRVFLTCKCFTGLLKNFIMTSFSTLSPISQTFSVKF